MPEEVNDPLCPFITADDARLLTIISREKSQDAQVLKCFQKNKLNANNERTHTWCPAVDLIIQRLKSNGFQVGSPDRESEVKVSWSSHDCPPQ